MVAVWFPFFTSNSKIDLQIDCLRWALRSVPRTVLPWRVCLRNWCSFADDWVNLLLKARKVMLTNMLGRVGKAALQDLYTIYSIQMVMFCVWLFQSNGCNCVFSWPFEPLVICWKKSIKKQEQLYTANRWYQYFKPEILSAFVELNECVFLDVIDLYEKKGSPMPLHGLTIKGGVCLCSFFESTNFKELAYSAVCKCVCVPKNEYSVLNLVRLCLVPLCSWIIFHRPINLTWPRTTKDDLVDVIGTNALTCWRCFSPTTQAFDN